MRAAAVVLAAGVGSRLGGVAKATLALPDGRTFVAAIADAARAGGCARIVVVVAAPHEDVVEAAARAAACDEVVRNPGPERGMASSLCLALRSLVAHGFDAALAWPVDHPLVRPDTVAAVVAAASRGRIVVPDLAGRGGHPTAFGADLWPEVEDAAAAEGGARAVVARDPGRVVRVAVDDPGVRLDIDTHHDLRSLS